MSNQAREKSIGLFTIYQQFKNIIFNTLDSVEMGSEVIHRSVSLGNSHNKLWADTKTKQFESDFAVELAEIKSIQATKLKELKAVK